MQKVLQIAFQSTPVLLMIALIPFIGSDHWLMVAYIAVIVGAFLLRREPHDLAVFTFGFFAMIVSEYLFVSTGAEIFLRTSFFGWMPVWLPFLWGYGFVAIKRSVRILDERP